MKLCLVVSVSLFVFGQSYLEFLKNDAEDVPIESSGCGMYEMVNSCCLASYVKTLNIGVCSGYEGLEDVVGFSSTGTEIMEGDSERDAFAGDVKPGPDEGACHVFKVTVGDSVNSSGGKKCVPGNMVQVAIQLQDLIGPNGECLVDFASGDCNKALEVNKHYQFAIRLDEGVNIELTEDLRSKYKCEIKQVGADNFVMCSL